jgi:hypothetical protein
MGYSGEQKVGTQDPQYRRIENPPSNAVIIEEASARPARQPASAPRRIGRFNLPSLKGGRVEQLGFLVIVAAALVLLLLFAGTLIPRVMGGVITALYTSMFVSLLTLANLRRPSGWANSLMGRQVFPVLNAGSDGQIWKLALVNGILVFIFAFAFDVLASFITPLLAGLVVFGGLVAASIFLSRARGVIQRP